MRVPKFKIMEPEDAYAWYVMILGIPESYFWDADIVSVNDVAADKAAYDGWLTAEREHQSKRR